LYVFYHNISYISAYFLQTKDVSTEGNWLETIKQ